MPRCAVRQLLAGGYDDLLEDILYSVIEVVNEGRNAGSFE